MEEVAKKCPLKGGSISENLKIHTGEKSHKCNGGEKREDVGEMRPLKGEGVSEVPPLPY